MCFKNLFFVLISSFIIVSCSEGDGKGSDSTGPGSEILVVGITAKWDGPVGDTIRRVLTRNMEGLPEVEPEYALIFIPETSFSTILQTHRNVLIMDINPANKKSSVETLHNIWAHPQWVIKIKASSDTAFISAFAKHSEAIMELFNQNERARFTARNALSQNTAVEKVLAADFGISMVISKDYYQAKKVTNFVWLRADTNANSLGLMIYTYPFKDISEVNPDSVLATRERYTKQIIADSAADLYKRIEHDMYKTISRKILFKGMYALETRGFRNTKAGVMGEPFINYTIVDAPRQRIVVFDGSVYSSTNLKRNYIRQLEAIIWGAEFTDPVIGVKE
jgi:hypothetical protein